MIKKHSESIADERTEMIDDKRKKDRREHDHDYDK